MNKKLRFPAIGLLVAAMLLTGCPGDEPGEDTPPNGSAEWPADVSVYAAGYENAGDAAEARLWKNGTVQNLSGKEKNKSRSARPLPIEELQTLANAVFVSGEDTYVAGYEIYMANGESVVHALLWKNGELQPLEGGTDNDLAMDVFVEGSDVYVLGLEENYPPVSGHNFKLKIWKNGVAETITTGYFTFNDLRRLRLFVHEGDTYIASPSTRPATIWKNKEAVVLGTSKKSGTYSIYVSSGDVYAAGEEDGKACLWKNGTVQELEGSADGEAFSVYVVGEDVYVAGGSIDRPTLWKNGKLQDTGDARQAVLLTDVAVHGDDVYLAGYVQIDPGPSAPGGPVLTSYLKAYVWRNGKQLELQSGKNAGSEAYSLCVR